MRNHAVPQIDFATAHLWPDSWLPGGGGSSEEAGLRFARRWINSHVDACAKLGKPLVLSEFGKKPAGPARAAFYEKVGGRSLFPSNAHIPPSLSQFPTPSLRAVQGLHLPTGP